MKKLSNPFRDLTRFEAILLALSLGVVAASGIISGTESLLSTIASLVGVTALIFVAKGYVIGQVFVLVFSVLYGINSFFFAYYGEMITYLGMSAPAAAATIIAWLRHPYKGTKEVKVNRLTKRTVTVMIIATAAVTTAFYFILGALGNANLFVSTLSIATSFLASLLTFWRSPYYALAYASNDIVLIILWILAAFEDISYLPMVFCFIMFLLNDLYGFYSRKRMEKDKSKSRRAAAFLFTKILNITINRGSNYADCRIAVCYLVNCCVLVFKVLVNREEVAHFIENMLWELVYVLVVIVGGIAERNRNYFLVVTSAVHHRNNAYRICAYKRQRLKSLRAKQKHVKRVAVIAVGARDKTVICRIVR